MPPSTRHLQLFNGLDYHVLEWAPDDPACDHTVVLVHGYLDLAWGWRPVVDAGLAGRFHIVAPDMRGHGDSGRIGAGGYYHFMDYLADLDDLVGKLGRARVSLVGHSMGGTITGMYAGAFPQLVHRLALLEGMGPPVPSTPAPERVAGWIKSWRTALAAPPRSYADRAQAAARLQSHDPKLDDELAAELAELGTLEGPEGVHFKHDPLHLTRGPYPFRLEFAQELWRNITCPTLLIDAADSHFARIFADIEERYACVPHAERHTIADAGHMMHRHQPKALAERLIAFLES
ncbi:alpha/beta fold hydrolase [Haliangium ochraceum]|uniref:Alpha/beta hydrolase fold protein n=1 Tax=Haliangium ochraceum (strain DSM 14365 / JCM 11303 / SMP-2) TaxID=502025 RepID=D0LRG9_HALO1|nr:alpha/beta hydrolase [Haliangium ochraceum]ACY17197.1 alpha/beta hydrolase fold protein [Haliangium ochraceum DSM 14365]